MEWLKLVLTALGSLVTLFILTKLMGNKQMSQLSMFDYINGITIGSIAAEMATSLEDDFRKPLIAMVIYAIVAFIISILTCKSIRLRKWLTGTPLVLYENGKLYARNLLKAKLDLGDLLTQCRNSGYFNLADLQTAILEPNGKISFLPLASQRPVTPADLNLNLPYEQPAANIIMDGHVLSENLRATGNNEIWLEKQLHAQGVSSVKDVFLATCDQNNQVSIYVKINAKVQSRRYE